MDCETVTSEVRSVKVCQEFRGNYSARFPIVRGELRDLPRAHLAGVMVAESLPGRIEQCWLPRVFGIAVKLAVG